ncbi:hypothetical protein LCGC14_3054100, partial [marine sediment metagenome]
VLSGVIELDEGFHLAGQRIVPPVSVSGIDHPNPEKPPC